jgi:hypothetical protein
MPAQILSWLALLARSDSAKDVEILACATGSRCCAAEAHVRR